MDRLRSTRLALGVALALGTCHYGGVALAETATATGLEEVVVTARKRTENLQDVGASVSALGAVEIARRFDVDLQSFSNSAPNVVIDDLQQGPGSPAAISIRGIGTTDVEKSFDPTTGVVLDGVFIGANSGAMLKALDLQSVEILRGPQGTLFGRNSIAGVINVARRRPDAEPAGEFRVGYGNYADIQADGFLNFPLGEKVAMKLNLAKRQRDGYFYDPTLGKHVGGLDYFSWGAGLDWKPVDGMEFYYRFDRSQQRQDANTVQNMAQPDQIFCIAFQQCAQSVKTPQSGNRYTVLQNGDGQDSFFNSDMHVLQAKWEFVPNYRLDYVFGYFKTGEGVYQDWDGTPLTLYHTDRPATYDQRSHELRLSYNAGEALSYTVGVYHWTSGYKIDLRNYIGFFNLFVPSIPPGTVVISDQTVEQTTKSDAVFFEGDYKLTSNLTLTVGGRYTKDKKTSGVVDVSMPELATLGSPDNPFKADWKQFTPKVSLRYRVNDGLMFYGLYSRGFRAGGFDGRPGAGQYLAAATPYNPEKVDNFEAGWKSEWLDRRVRLNGSIFFMKYKDKQEEQSVPVQGGTGQQTLVYNASSADLKGVELELQTKLAAGLGVNAALGFLDAKYKDFVDPVTGTDLSYLKLRRAPKVTATLSPTYEWDALNGHFWVQADAHYQSKTELTFLNSPQGANPATTILDASVNFKFRNTTMSVWGANLTNEDSWAQAYDVGSAIGFAGLWTYAATRPPRTYGFRLQQSF
jgi:iron complex outermembrane receptor protein